MMVEIKGYYSHDVHMINVDSIRSVSYSSPRHGGKAEHRELCIMFENNTLCIDFLKYVERGQREYDIIIEAMRANHRQYVSNNTKEKI